MALSMEQLRRLNLFEVLLEEAESIGSAPTNTLPTEEDVIHWEEERIRAIFAANATPAQPQSTGSSTTPLHHIHASSGVTEAQAQLQQGSETSPHPAGRAWCVGDKEALRQRFPMPAQDVLDKWLPGLKRTKATAPRLRVVCLHSAGNGEDMWTNEGSGVRRAPCSMLEWCRAHSAEVLAPQLPGRGSRFREPFLPTAQAIAQTLLPILAPFLLDPALPYVLVSHSMGCWLGFELLHVLRGVGLPVPHAWCASAMPAPDIPEGRRPWRRQVTLGHADFQDEMRGWDIREAVFSQDMWALYCNILRADCTLFDSYDYSTSHAFSSAAHGAAVTTVPLLPVPMTVFYGTRDKRVTRELVEGWQRFTPHPLHVHSVEGGHMWPVDKQARIPWVKSIVQVLQDVLDGSS